MAKALIEALKGTAVVLTPDLPLHPKKALIEEFAELEAVQFNHCNPYYKNRVWGLFGEQEVKTWYAPLDQKMMMEFSRKEQV